MGVSKKHESGSFFQKLSALLDITRAVPVPSTNAGGEELLLSGSGCCLTQQCFCCSGAPQVGAGPAAGGCAGHVGWQELPTGGTGWGVWGLVFPRSPQSVPDTARCWVLLDRASPGFSGVAVPSHSCSGVPAGLGALPHAGNLHSQVFSRQIWLKRHFSLAGAIWCSLPCKRDGVTGG